ncbi:MAG TPA: LytTR family DNA-binding domain-containing protein [Bacteroidia bacterium]|nr:LytTR family DNA-binding domain-containing protein [Bacteroidia bacterium]
MNYIIIEDENPAAKRLERMVSEINPEYKLLSIQESIESSVEWLLKNPKPDFCLMDIELADGQSFEIFKRVKIEFPVIFTTAFDEYAAKAFRLNSVDYLLKPVKKEELSVALNRVSERVNRVPVDIPDFSKLVQSLAPRNEFQKRILIRYGDTLKALEISDAAYFYTENRINYMISKDSASYPLDMNLDQLEQVLDPQLFFRINRQFIVNVNSIKRMTAWSKSRIKLDLNPACEIETIVSTERSPEFKIWITGQGDS